MTKREREREREKGRVGGERKARGIPRRIHHTPGISSFVRRNDYTFNAHVHRDR